MNVTLMIISSTQGGIGSAVNELRPASQLVAWPWAHKYTSLGLSFAVLKWGIALLRWQGLHELKDKVSIALSL